MKENIFAGEEDVTFVITRLSFNSTVYPYDKSYVQTGKYMYRVAAFMGETPLKEFPAGISFSFLDKTSVFDEGTGVYELDYAERAWSKLEKYKIGSNVISATFDWSHI